jgi:tRNA(His) guanylyltransferase
MKFDDLETKMRIYETAHDVCAVPGMYLVARIDGRSFTRLTKKDVHGFEAPFDVRFRDMMVETVKHLMNSGFTVTYGYTQSDEISLLFAMEESSFGRKHRKYNSILAAEASAKFSMLLGAMGTFDCRLIELPNAALVIDYFRWRNEDAHRNSLNGYCYWKLRQNGLNERQATRKIEGITVAAKNELLFELGINFNDVPLWTKRGVGLYWTEVEKEGFNPKTKETVVTMRRQIHVDMQLPMRDEYSAFVNKFL